MMQRLPLTNNEAEQFAKQKEIVALRLLKPQPPEGLELKFIEGNDALFKGISSGNEWMWDAYVPYPSGVYDLTETWGTDLLGRLLYKADYVRKYYTGFAGRWWYSPVTMPVPRWKDIKATTTVKRVQDVTDIEWLESREEFANGGYQDIIDHWNALHAKPVKQDDGYVCYPYDWDSFERIYGDKYLRIKHIGDRDFTEPTHKRKPLTIHPNPWLMAIELRSE